MHLAQENRTIMLQTISWSAYFITIGLSTALYYGWWLIRYYPDWQTRQPDPPEGKPAEKGTAAVTAGPMEKTVTGAVTTSEPQGQQQEEPPQALQQQAEQSQPELPFPHPAFLATIAANCKNDLLRVFEKASMAAPSETEWLELLRGLLTADPYPKLNRTIFQENIDALIVREMARYGSIHLAPETVRELWKLDG